MSYLVLARKWRPKKFSEVVGQDHITQSIKNALTTNSVGHAYLLVGTRGVGKTTMARLFAKALRCESLTASGDACGACAPCLEFDTDNSMNVIEIDGASNNSVDNVRDLIESVQFLPTNGKRKVYIIDEVHMLSNSAFNALLKTLEEPPAHVVFILATTEAQKLLGTVLSRCQRFDFRNISESDLKNHLKNICATEGIKADDRHLAIIAKLGRGSGRDTLSLLDQALAFSVGKVITDEVLSKSLGIASVELVNQLVQNIYLGNESGVRSAFQKFFSENIPLGNVIESVLEVFYSHLEKFSQKQAEVQDLSKAELIWLFETLAKDAEWGLKSILPEKAVEMILVKLALRREFFQKPKALEKKTEVAPIVQNPQYLAEEKKPDIKQDIKPEVKSANKEFTWEGFLSYLLRLAPASASNLEQGNLVSSLVFDGKMLSLEIGFNYSGKVFFDYLNDQEVIAKIRNHLCNYFEVENENLNLALKLIDAESEFKSTADIRQEQEEEAEENKINSIRNNPFIKQAEVMFNAKIDKVILEKRNK